MKLKKLLAGITAAALAVSAMAFSSLTASAVDPDMTISVYASDGSKSVSSVSEPVSLTYGQGKCDLEWSSIGTDAYDGSTIETITGAGIVLTIPGFDNAGKSVELTATVNVYDEEGNLDLSQSDTWSETFEINPWAKEDIVEAEFNEIILTNTIGKSLKIDCSINFKNETPENQPKVYEIGFDSSLELPINIESKDNYEWGFDGKPVELSSDLVGNMTFDEFKNAYFKFEPVYVNDSEELGAEAYNIKLEFCFEGTGDSTKDYGAAAEFGNFFKLGMENWQISYYGETGDGNEATGSEKLVAVMCFASLKSEYANKVEVGDNIIVNENKNATVRELKFPSGEIDMEVRERDWEGDEKYTNYASSDGYSINVEGIEYETTTYGTLRKEKFKITGADFKGSTLEGVKAEDVEVRPVLYFKNDGDRSYTNWDITMSSVNGLSMYFSDVYNQEDGKPIGTCLTDNAIIENICIEVFIKGTAAGIDNLPVGTIFTINPADVPTYEIPFSKDEHILKVQDAEWGKEAEGEKFSKYAQIWKEVTDVKDIEIGTTTYGQVKDAKFAVTGIDLKDCSLGADVKAEDVQVTVFVKFADKVENPTKEIFFKKFGSMSSSTIGGQLSSLRREDDKGAETQDIPGDNYVITEIGYELFINGNLYKIDSMENGAEVIINKAPAEENPSDTPSNTPSTGTQTPAASHTSVGMPAAVIGNNSADTAAAGTSESEKKTVSLKESTSVSKDTFAEIAGKDIDVEFELSNGVTWEINGLDVKDAQKIDLGVTLKTKKASAKQLETIAKDKDTFQFSIRHNGDFGFKAVVNIPINKKYNGQFANLYWFHDGKFDFVGSSKVEDGIADFTMTHASDYVIVFDEEAYGEDVSSGAGVYEEESETSAPAAVVVTFAALAVSAIILKKRVF